MSRFIQLHLLTSYPPANLNRDDLGRPKTAKMGGVDRLRVSSQSLKRAWRTSDLFERAMKDHIGTRTKEMGRKVYARLLEKGIGHKDALAWAGAIAGVFGKLKKLTDNEKKALKDLPATKRREKELVEVEIEQLAFFDQGEELAVLELTNRIAERKEGPQPEELNLLRQKMTSVDIALFGRMLASSPAFNVDAACQVAHAISVHPVVIEDDYFTAVDDLNDGSEDAGAAHIGETGFAAGLFYSYICINHGLLVDNLGGDDNLAQRAIASLTEAAVKVPPNGKQNSFASRAYASYVLAEKGDQQPRALSVAFLKPIDNRTLCRDEQDFGTAAVQALETHRKNLDKVYGNCADEAYAINALTGEGTMADLLDFVIG
ncbi:type I-E CRISPR-associated protein Cas7/Cse4/CasC [Syntrophotalea acetylenica]|jgi:CRISPR system Cascade subunit CasC|uniref:Type I-E CRISPR-associated protein Cas7/Cse4/CasC n=1 Tax=Syntrophotalea acetylenica TaxID=29542 RepID=A0A1L3GHA9_SYNAC|nr:type I-E CRISPR-associated protein Cas7/Cse4/CasC [Syntrophotalea acetylenica]APG43385.1 type I-E CRISPR-associated protein Cas7/Cse4/CasC [Syntrophotalea acetylenica]